MYLRRSAFLKIIVASVAVAVFYCEWLVYIIQPRYWAELRCPQDETCTKILLIADPQIQGELWTITPLNHLLIWDSDQYLQLTYSVVTEHFKPDMQVYLGDIMDEGSIASMSEYQRYVRRIKNIFMNNYASEMAVWLPGDNDIGGENEPIKSQKIDSFEQFFQKASVITSRNITYYKVNAITRRFPKLVDNSTTLYKIVVSHYPLTNYHLWREVAEEIHPNIMFCAHSHYSKYVKITGKENFNKRMYDFIEMKETLQVPTDDEVLYEISVPTCSYRMGTNKIGYGAAIYEHKSGTLTYMVFWSPQRFPYLFFYLVVLVVVSIYLAISYLSRRSKQRYGLISIPSYLLNVTSI